MKKHPTPMLDQLEQRPLAELRLRHQAPAGRARRRARRRRRQLAARSARALLRDPQGLLEGRHRQCLRLRRRHHPAFLRGRRGSVPESKEFHTLRVQPPAGNYYTTDMLRQLADSWEKWGSGLVTFHGQTGNIMFIGANTENTQHFFDEINEYGFDLGGAGPACAPPCPASVGALRAVLRQRAQDSPLAGEQLHRRRPPSRPALQVQVQGLRLPERLHELHRAADFAVIGTWRDDMKVDQEEVKAYVARRKGRKYVIDNVITRCPTKALSLNDDDTLAVDNKRLRALHALPERHAKLPVTRATTRASACSSAASAP